ELALSVAGGPVEPVTEAFDRNAPLRERAVEPIGRLDAAHGMLSHRTQTSGAQHAPDPDLQAGCSGALIASVLEHFAQTARSGPTLAAEAGEPTSNERDGGEPAMDCILDGGGEVLVVEHAGQVDERARRTRQPDRPQHSDVVGIDEPAVNDDQVG